MKKINYKRARGGRALSLLLDMSIYNQACLSRKLGVSRAVVNRWVTGERPIPSRWLPSISNFLDLGADGRRLLYRASTPRAYSQLERESERDDLVAELETLYRLAPYLKN